MYLLILDADSVERGTALSCVSVEVEMEGDQEQSMGAGFLIKAWASKGEDATLIYMT